MEPTTEVLTTAEAPKTTESEKVEDVKIDEVKENGDSSEKVSEEEIGTVDEEKPAENGSNEEPKENGHAEEPAVVNGTPEEPKENGIEEERKENGAVEDEDKEANKENGVDHEPPVKKAKKTPTKEERSPSRRRSSSRLVNQEEGKELPKEISSDNLENLKRKVPVN